MFWMCVFPESCDSEMLSYDASGDVIRDPSVNFQDAYAPPINAAIGYHHNNQIQTANQIVCLVIVYTCFAIIR